MIRMQKIDVWQDRGWLEKVLIKALGNYNPESGTYQSFFFGDIWAPILEYDPQTGKMAEEPTWTNFGFTPIEVAECYWAHFGANYFPDFYRTDAEFDASMTVAGFNKVASLIHAVFVQNKLKYRKLIELAGYYYNPLFNVDGVEMFSSADAHGDETERSIFSTTTKHSVAPYDGDANNTKLEYSDETSSRKPAEGDTQDLGGNTLTRSHDSTEIDVSAADDAFKNGITGSDFYHAEKRIRQGNIGVTKSQELIAAERENLKWTLLNEFFTDINEVVLIGLY